ncbi:hypothetical protein FIV35_06330 [Pseudomonas rhodesiae]|nr:hypothetical protein FIV35_06330 [Pseudomonas rhodesiae]
MNFPWNSLTSALCPRIDTAIKERWFKEYRGMRFIRMMKRNKGTKEKMWAGHTAPFFACRKVKAGPGNAKRPARGLLRNGEAISVRGRRFCRSCHPTLRRQAARLSSR